MGEALPHRPLILHHFNLCDRFDHLVRHTKLIQPHELRPSRLFYYQPPVTFLFALHRG